jgi:hypothetical protein
MKGTANMSGTDIDLFISLSEQTTETLKEIYDKLFNTMKANAQSLPPQSRHLDQDQRGDAHQPRHARRPPERKPHHQALARSKKSSISRLSILS